MKITKQRLREIIKEELGALSEGDWASASKQHGLAASMPHPFDPPRRRPRDEKPFQEKQRVSAPGRGEGTIHSVWKHNKAGWVADVNWDDPQHPRKETTPAGRLSLAE